MDWQEFDKNRAAFPPEELLAYRGQYIAWSFDGTRIIASDKDGLKLDDTVRALGYDPAEVTFSSVPDAERLFIEGPICAREKSRDNRGFPSPRTASAILDLSQFNKNRQAFPPEELLPYAGKYIGWSPDASRIIASDEDESRLVASIRQLGYDLGTTLISYVPDGDDTLFSGGMFSDEEFLDVDEGYQA
jgi:hypothetical protein